MLSLFKRMIFLLIFVGNFFGWIVNLDMFSHLHVDPLLHFWIYNGITSVTEQVRNGDKQIASFAEADPSQVFQKMCKSLNACFPMLNIFIFTDGSSSGKVEDVFCQVL